MTETLYCYHCRTQHPKEEMRLVVSKTGKRWRCIKSIRAARNPSIAQRDEFGRRVTESNKAQSQLKMKLRASTRHLDNET